MLTVCTSALDTSGCLIKTAKSLLGIVGASDDALLGTLGDRALEAVENYLGSPLRLQVDSEAVAGYGSRYLTDPRHAGWLRSEARGECGQDDLTSCVSGLPDFRTGGRTSPSICSRPTSVWPSA